MAAVSLQKINPELPKTGHTQTLEQKLRRLRKVSQQFEAIFVRQMLQAMRKTVPNGGLLERGLQMEVYESLFDEKVAERIAQRNQLGLADLVFRQLAGKLKGGKSLEELLKGMEKVRREGAAPPLDIQVPGTAGGEVGEIVRRAARTFGLDENLIHAVIQTESGGNPLAVSRRGAKGLMQLMDETARMLGVRNPFDVEENIFGGTRYLKQLLEKFDNDIELALAAYNAGPGNVERYGGIPPFAETRAYVRRVLEIFNRLQNQEPVQEKRMT